MFKKLKDKLAEEVKSSPQRIQQFAQAAQAAVTSASSSISDITNSDLFSIGDNDSQQSNSSVKTSPSQIKNTFQDVSLVQPGNTSSDSTDFASSHDYKETPRQRRLSNSSFASDVSFRLPSYESPSMYHLQSDMEISASEAEERGFGTGAVSLDRVTKEQLYAAYRRTQDRYTKYRTQYADLARHYKLLERENAKARSVLVETQDKALRRISELREQCSLEQSAKAHLEKALREEIEEKNMKIDTLNTKIQLLQQSTQDIATNDKNDNVASGNENNVQLINFDNESNVIDESVSTEVANLNIKIDKLEKLITKYKDSLKTQKEKNSQLTADTQMLSTELDAKKKEIEELKISNEELEATKTQIQELNELNEQLQNKINAFDFNKSKELTTLEADLQKAQDEINELRGKIEVFTKREEEYAISLAENKLSIHKELEAKESEIKSLKDLLSTSKQEIQSLNIVITEYKDKISQLEDEKAKYKNALAEFDTTKIKLTEIESQLQSVSQKCLTLESAKAKADEEYKCLQLQLKQETAEKLAMIDRNTYLEERNTQLTDENVKKTTQISALDNELKQIKNDVVNDEISEKQKLLEELSIWKNKYSGLEAEIQEERDELVKLQSEIEKLLANDELTQIQNSELNIQLSELKSENELLLNKLEGTKKIKQAYEQLVMQIKNIKKVLSLTSHEFKTWKDQNGQDILTLKSVISGLLQKLPQLDDVVALKAECENQKSLHYASRLELMQVSEEFQTVSAELNSVREENSKLKSEINNTELISHEFEAEIQRMKTELQGLLTEKNNWEEKLNESNTKYTQLQSLLDQDHNECSILKQDIANMVDRINNLEHENISLNTQLNKLKEEQNENVGQINALRQENASLIAKKNDAKENRSIVLEMETKITNLTHENISLKKQHDVNAKEINERKEEMLNQINLLKKDNESLASKNSKDALIIETLQENVQDLTQQNISLKNQSDTIDELKKKQDDYYSQINTLKSENLLLNNKHNSFAEEKLSIIERLQETVKDLTQENFTLKTQSEKITDSVKQLEVELREVRQSHVDMEVEKDRLNSIIEVLEKKEQENKNTCKDTQTEIEESLMKSNTVTDLSTPFKENTPDETAAYNCVISENETLKEENKRLQSDVTGLQTYLAKISKENSELNDKLRELIACSENSSEKNDIDQHLAELKEKLDVLIRDNTLLLEENLELKDQLSSHNYTVPAVMMEQNKKSSDYLNLLEKYNNLLDNNSKLENRMLELESMNKCFNGNVIEVQENNEKLRLTNEKLERRLDEALVSLRHLHSLQENTELEYLRNILYEYLTGTGAHSETLAKVLAAVVKFDERQTQQVLQKEKERQGILRQLGII